MIEQQITRRCGNCAKPVGATDVLCPHCDVLLAAYEAPAGATVGTPAAINPVDTAPAPQRVDPEPPAPSPTPSVSPQAPYQSPTAQSLDALDAHKPQAGTISTTFHLPESSPVAEALERTRVAADLDARGERSPDNEQDVPPSAEPVAEEQRQLFGMSVKPIHEPDPDPSPASPPQTPVAQPSRPQERQSAIEERVRAQAEVGRAEGNRDVQQIARQATDSRPMQPTPQQRAQPPDPPARPASQDRNAQGKKSSGIGSFIAFFIVVVLVLRVLGSGIFPAFLILPIIVIGLIWFMTTVAKKTGRKTTQMQKDQNRRKQEVLRRDRRLPR